MRPIADPPNIFDKADRAFARVVPSAVLRVVLGLVLVVGAFALLVLAIAGLSSLRNNGVGIGVEVVLVATLLFALQRVRTARSETEAQRWRRQVPWFAAFALLGLLRLALT